MDELNLIAKALIGLSGTGGGVVGAVMFYSWREERTERRALQEKLVKLLEDTLTTRLELATVLQKVLDKVGA